MTLPTDAKSRKDQPIARGLLDFFPDACAAVAELSRISNEQHNPGEPMHWAREKSPDQADCIVRHLIDRGKLDIDGVLHDVKVAWRALAMAQLAIEARQRSQVNEPKPLPFQFSDGSFCTCSYCRAAAQHQQGKGILTTGNSRRK